MFQSRTKWQHNVYLESWFHQSHTRITFSHWRSWLLSVENRLGASLHGGNGRTAGDEAGSLHEWVRTLSTEVVETSQRHDDSSPQKLQCISPKNRSILLNLRTSIRAKLTAIHHFQISQLSSKSLFKLFSFHSFFETMTGQDECLAIGSSFLLF